MSRVSHLFILMLLVLFSSCGARKNSYTISSIQGQYIPVLNTINPDSSMVEFVDSYKLKLDDEMNKVIGYSAIDMSTGRPESLLTNLISDLMRNLDQSYTGGQKADIGFMNVFGVRAPILKGEITRGDIYTSFPFDNALFVLQIRGKYLKDIFSSYAKMGGAGVSENVELVIKDEQVESLMIDGKPLDDNKLYTIVTLDYLAEGNDGMDALTNAEWSAETGLTLRDFMLKYIAEIAKEGKQLSSVLDGRITIIK